MNQSMINSAVTMGQVQYKLDNVGHNLANADTTGFKRRDTSFADLMFRQVQNQRVGPYEEGRDTPAGIRRGSGAGVAQTAIRFEQGTLQQTGRDLDAAITEPGFFFELAAAEDGTRRFTRDGAFYLSPAEDGTNQLVNGEGEYILGADGAPAAIPENYAGLRIDETGGIFVTDEDGTEIAAGALQTVEITKPQLLEQQGGGIVSFPDLEELGAAEADVLADGNGAQVVQQQALEMANVDTAKQMSDMVAAQRHYQFNASAANMTDQMMGMVTNLR
ncbi:flagellar hook-basal body protein [Bacillus luteus]|uniref:Flagellar hook-basal body protein n=2 Tax=Alkalicoccus luteus TaxID=1237094 RepID=A0A969TUT4_9BACI|nr:flagellar hook-basal body protein [Alkalicoccus luteus]